MSIDKELLDRLMEGRSPGDLFGQTGILAELTKALAERALSTEMDVHLDEERSGGADRIDAETRSDTFDRDLDAVGEHDRGRHRAERERGEGGERERRIAPHHSQRVTHVLRERFHRREGPRFARLFPQPQRIANPPPRGRPRPARWPRHKASHVGSRCEAVVPTGRRARHRPGGSTSRHAMPVMG